MELELMELRFMISIDLDTTAPHRCLDTRIPDTTRILTRNFISCLLSQHGLRLPPITIEYVIDCGSREFGFRGYSVHSYDECCCFWIYPNADLGIFVYWAVC